MSTPPFKVLLVYPRFAGTSFWNYRRTCEFLGAKYSAAPLGPITVAAILPQEWEFRLVNRNTEELSDTDLAWADLVITGGMLPQQRDTLHVIERAHAAGKLVAVGGPDATCTPEAYAVSDFLVQGEGEEVLPELVQALRSGARSGRFAASRFPDVTRSPTPRFDLLKFDHYLHVGIQFSRGCPFSCEFCGVVELNGRTPRTKTIEQVLAELDALYALGYRGHVDFVDDNLIGNRKAAKPLLRALPAWLKAHGYPFEFSTEASLDIADDPELLELMKKANFFAVFLGIETPDPVALAEAHKRQNVKRDLAATVQTIHRAGIFANAGFILGFDAERGSVADAMVDCIEATSIPICMVGLLFALPRTKLAERLQAEGRIIEAPEGYTDSDADQCTSGLNFHTRRPRREILADYREVLSRIYAPAAYFGRARRVGRELDYSEHRVRQPLRHIWRDLRAFGRMAWHMGVRDPLVRREWWHSFFDCLFHNPAALRIVLSFAALYLHIGPFTRQLLEHLDRELASEPAPNSPETSEHLGTHLPSLPPRTSMPA